MKLNRRQFIAGTVAVGAVAAGGPVFALHVMPAVRQRELVARINSAISALDANEVPASATAWIFVSDETARAT